MTFADLWNGSVQALASALRLMLCKSCSLHHAVGYQPMHLELCLLCSLHILASLPFRHVTVV